MTLDYEEARAVAYEQTAFWLRQGITPGLAYSALTGHWRRGKTWSDVDGELIRWWIRNTERLAA